MKLSRREMLLASVGLLVGGCAPAESGPAGYGLSHRPHTAWPDAISRPAPLPGVVAVAPRPQAAPAVVRPATAVSPHLTIISRSAWAKAGPNTSRINPMNGINRITVHHEGWTPVWFSDYAASAERLEDIRHSHVNYRHWADIGYHYVVDRGGRVWEARDIRYQGAHVSHNNEHNLGIMFLGNFDRQSPSSAQLATLRTALYVMMHRFSVPVSRVYTHQELRPTRCPGTHMQPRVVALRNSSYLG